MTFNPSDNHWTVKNYRERVTKEQLQDLLMNRPDPIVAGKLREWDYEKVGPGVYEIWIGDKPDLSEFSSHETWRV